MSIPDDQLSAFRSRLMEWYHRNARFFPWRKKTATAYEQILAEILLQKTQAEKVAGFFFEFLKRYPSWSKLAEAREDQLKDFLYSMGLWRRKAASLCKLAATMAQRRGRFPRERGELEALPGVGQYTASAILLFRYNDAQPLLDVNMARIIERYFGVKRRRDLRHDQDLRDLAERLVKVDDPICLNWAVLDFGAIICTPRSPRCSECPLVNGCSFARQWKPAEPKRNG